MKIAIVHDYLCGVGGSERVFKYICEEFQEADVFTLALNRKKTLPFFSDKIIKTTYLNYFVRSMRTFRLSFPLATRAMAAIDLKNYDLVLSSSATVAKYVKVPNGIHICYCYIPTRALWQTHQYFRSGFEKFLVSPFLNYLRLKDIYAASKVNHFIAISENTREHIKLTYSRSSDVLYCPIDLSLFQKSSVKEDHFLIVSRLEQWKKIDYAVEAFNRLGLPLKIIGSGKEESRLKEIAKANISFLGQVDDVTLSAEYAKAKAVIFTPMLEYGLVPLEAVASGTPVIAYGYGGIEETMIPLNPIVTSNSKASPTALFFYEQNSEALADAVLNFDQSKFDPEDLISYASKWGIPEFKSKLRAMVMSYL